MLIKQPTNQPNHNNIARTTTWSINPTIYSRQQYYHHDVFLSIRAIVTAVAGSLVRVILYTYEYLYGYICSIYSLFCK
jgi:hypothetical protein